MINLSKAGTKIVGKTFSYRLNAIIDSYIARGLMQTVSGLPIDSYSEETQFRVDAFKDISSKLNNQDSFLLGVAFAQYYVNASWDVLYPKMFEKAFPYYFTREISNLLAGSFVSISETELGLQVFDASFGSYVTSIIKSAKSIGIGDFDAVKRMMIRSTGLEGKVIGSRNTQENTETTLDLSQKDSFLLGIYMTQELNRAHNFYIYESKNAKLSIIEEVSVEFSHPAVFVDSSLGTQGSAAWWDKQFLRVFALRYRDLFGQKRVMDFIHDQVQVYNQKLRT